MDDLPPKKSHLSRDQNPDSMVFTPNIVATLCMYVPTYLSTHPFQPTPEAIVEVRLGEARWLMNGQRHDVNPRPDRKFRGRRDLSLKDIPISQLHVL